MSSDNDDQLYSLPIRSSLNRPNLIMGGEREPTLIIIVLVVILAGATMTLIGILTGLVVYILGISTLRRMAKVDPMLSVLYRKHIRYRSYYPCRATPWRSH